MHFASQNYIDLAQLATTSVGLSVFGVHPALLQDLISYNATLTGSGAAWAQAFDLLAQLQSMLRATVVSRLEFREGLARGG